MEYAADLLYDLPKWYPLVFDGVHYIFCLESERADMGDDYKSVTRKNPLACWFASMLTCFAGGLLAAPLCGEPVLSALLGDPTRIAMATALWYLVFYSPSDAVAKVLGQTYSKVPLGLVKGLYYPKKIVGGLKHSKYVFKGCGLCGIMLATLKANGTGIIKPLARLARGCWEPERMESMKPSVTTKLCALCAAIYLAFPTDICYIFLVSIFVGLKVGPALGFPFDPFTKLEDAVSPVIFGGDEHKEHDKKE